MTEWFEDESFWRELYPYMFDENRFAQADEQVRKVLKLTGIRRGLPKIEVRIGIGTGPVVTRDAFLHILVRLRQ